MDYYRGFLSGGIKYVHLGVNEVNVTHNKLGLTIFLKF